MVRILRQCCDSLAEAHDRNLVHRDIKPGNIFLCRIADELDAVKVLEFGLAGEASPGGEDIVDGTPEYMAPEQAEGDAVDGRADLYALGCVAWWLLTGRTPFTAADPSAMMRRHIYEHPPALADTAAQPVPATLATLVHRLLEKNPVRRPPRRPRSGRSARRHRLRGRASLGRCQLPRLLGWHRPAPAGRRAHRDAPAGEERLTSGQSLSHRYKPAPRTRA